MYCCKHWKYIHNFCSIISQPTSLQKEHLHSSKVTMAEVGQSHRQILHCESSLDMSVRLCLFRKKLTWLAILLSNRRDIWDVALEVMLELATDMIDEHLEHCKRNISSAEFFWLGRRPEDLRMWTSSDWQGSVLESFVEILFQVACHKVPPELYFGISLFLVILHFLSLITVWKGKFWMFSGRLVNLNLENWSCAWICKQNSFIRWLDKWITFQLPSSLSASFQTFAVSLV